MVHVEWCSDELTERPQVAGWQRRLLLRGRKAAALPQSLLQTTTAVLPEIAGAEVLLAESTAALAGTCLQCTRSSYTCLP